jgi:hypothetical protein
MKFRLSRPCYDKPHRCPGWAGGGNRFPSEKGEAKYGRCENGSIRTRMPRGGEPGDDYPGIRKWHFGRCTNSQCKVVTWPWALRWIDPSWTISWVKWKLFRR